MLWGMSDLTPRRAREQRAYAMVLVGGGSGALAVVTFVLAVVGVVGFGLPVLLAIVAAVAYFLFRRQVGAR